MMSITVWLRVLPSARLSRISWFWWTITAATSPRIIALPLGKPPAPPGRSVQSTRLISRPSAPSQSWIVPKVETVITRDPSAFMS
ncbi:MAG TPA: hypothetical protein VGO55_05270 [Allosphingosinicella sp.]|nr:hypothetical protein [Allosphingosinicella sp.]